MKETNWSVETTDIAVIRVCQAAWVVPNVVPKRSTQTHKVQNRRVKMADLALRWGKENKTEGVSSYVRDTAERGDGEQKALEKVRPPCVCQTI
jgi:hypothetical protein